MKVYCAFHYEYIQSVVHYSSQAQPDYTQSRPNELQDYVEV